MKDVLLKNFMSTMDAEMAKGLLEANNIKCTIQREGICAYQGGETPASVFVAEKDFDKASEIIKEFKEAKRMF